MKRVIMILLLVLGLSTMMKGYSQYDTNRDSLVSLIIPDSVDITDSTTADSVKQGVGGLNQLGSPNIAKVVSVPKIFWTVVVGLVSWFVINFLIRVVGAIGERNPKRRLTVKRLIPVIRIAGWTFVIYVIIVGVFQPPIETVIAFFASVGVAVGFASQDLLKNIFGGLVILFDRPFQVGDKIEVGSYYGEVLEIGLRSTRIVTSDDSVVTVPNSEMMNQSISNSNSGESNCQVVAEFFLPPSTDTAKARSIAIEAAQVSRYIYLNKPIVVVFVHETNQHRTHLKMRLKAYVSDIRDEFAFKSDMTELVMAEFIKAGIMPAQW